MLLASSYRAISLSVTIVRILSRSSSDKDSSLDKRKRCKCKLGIALFSSLKSPFISTGKKGSSLSLRFNICFKPSWKGIGTERTFLSLREMTKYRSEEHTSELQSRP